MKFLFIMAGILLFLEGCNQPANNRMQSGTTWGTGSFDSNGERIYFTATSERETPITYTGGPAVGMMMMGGHYACVSCHGADARGGRHMMHTGIMDAPDIRWSALSSDHHHGEEEHAEGEQEEPENAEEYSFEDFKNAVEKGQHPDGDKISTDMPRWKMSDSDFSDLMNYLKEL